LYKKRAQVPFLFKFIHVREQTCAEEILSCVLFGARNAYKNSSK